MLPSLGLQRAGHDVVTEQTARLLVRARFYVHSRHHILGSEQMDMQQELNPSEQDVLTTCHLAPWVRPVLLPREDKDVTEL